MTRQSHCMQCGSPLKARDLDGRTRMACASDDCDWVWWDNPTPVVAAVVENGADVLLVRSKGWPEKWLGLVAGFLESGETPEQAVLRELKEETDLRCAVKEVPGEHGSIRGNVRDRSESAIFAQGTCQPFRRGRQELKRTKIRFASPVRLKQKSPVGSAFVQRYWVLLKTRPDGAQTRQASCGVI